MSLRGEELGRRMADEHESLVQMIVVLREHLARSTAADGPWVDALRAAFDRLYAHVARQISMKEQGGYFESVVRERPMLARQATLIKASNGQLLRLADSIRRDLSQLNAEDKLLVRDACERIERFAGVLSEHEQRENMLALFAFNTDLGGD